MNPVMNPIDYDPLTSIKNDYRDGLLTQHGYIIKSCEALEVEPLIVDRGWLAGELGIKRNTLTSILSQMKAKGLISK
jgi:DNA-binding MarR family transcriptional regulator